MVCKSSEVLLNTITCSRISRNNLEHGNELQNSPRNKNLKKHGSNKQNVKTSMVELVVGQSHIGKHQLRIVRSSTGTTTLPKDSNRSISSSKTKPPQEISFAGNCLGRAALVAKKPPEELPHTSKRSHSFHNHRCSKKRVGGHGKRRETSRLMEPKSKTMAQQPKGTLDGTRSTKENRTHVTKSNCHVTDRQQISSGLHIKRGRDQVHKTSELDTRNTESGKPLSNHSHSEISPREIQPHSRPPIKVHRPIGVVIEQANTRHYFQEMGYPQHRSLCQSAVSDLRSIRERRCQRSTVSICRRVQQTMAISPRLDISSPSHDTENTPPLDIELRHIPPSGSEVGANILESGTQAAGTEPPVYNTESSQPPGRLENNESSTGSGRAMFAGMEGSGWASLVKSWPSDSQTLLETSWRKSTLKTYNSAWQRWKLWASDNNCNLCDPSAEEVAKYICFLHKTVKLAPKTIALHKSVVVTFANPENADKLNSHPLIRQLLKAVALTKPPINKPPTWNVSQLMEFLQHYPLDDKSLFQVSRHVSALLLLATGRRVHDLTLLDISPTSYESFEDHIILWPKFGSKTDSATFRQSGWKFSVGDVERLDVVKWVAHLINLSKDRRRACSSLNNLFITTRSKVKAASRTVIAGWLRTLFREANIEASPGSFRSAVNSDNWSNRNLNLDDVMKRGNWRSKDTFIKYYFKEVPARATNHTVPHTFSVTQTFSPI